MLPLGSEISLLEKLGASNTAAEIAAQPELWLEIYNQIVSDKKRIQSFIQKSRAEVNRIILTGAGSSAFIGLSLSGVYNRYQKIHTDSVATTDLLTHPGNFFFSDEAIVLVSFARSGNSPESTAVTALADKLSKKCFHIIITCDGNGSLANFRTDSEKLVIILPPSSNDKALAMTGSYSGMLLCGLLVARINEIESLKEQVEVICRNGRRVLDIYSPELKKLAAKEFSRAVFLGSGPLYGTATESQLKLQELTDGIIICKNDSYLGFRHGPKAVTDENTIVVFIFSNDPYVQMYERDLVKSMKKGKQPLQMVGIFETAPAGLEFDPAIKMSESGKHLDEEFLTICAILPGQLLGFYKSLALGLRPDNPSETGAISRVVEDVTIYQP